jgi:hypothetical protein
MTRHFSTVFTVAASLAGLALDPGLAHGQDRKDAVTYHDKKNNDDHQWNDHEDQAYKIYVKDNHRKSVEFTKLKPNDQQTYWNWRHQHSDASLKIDIR